MYKRIAGCSGALREKPDFHVSVADCVLAPLLTPSVRGLLPSTSAATFYSIFSVIILFFDKASVEAFQHLGTDKVPSV